MVEIKPEPDNVIYDLIQFLNICINQFDHWLPTKYSRMLIWFNTSCFNTTESVFATKLMKGIRCIYDAAPQ